MSEHGKWSQCLKFNFIIILPAPTRLQCIRLLEVVYAYVIFLAATAALEVQMLVCLSVCLSVCVSVTLATNVLKLKTSKFLDL